MEIIGLIAAVIGLISAFINRKQIIEYRYTSYRSTGAYRSSPGGLKRRFKRLGLAVVGVFVTAAIGGGTTDTGMEQFMMWIFAGCFFYASYQLLAIVIVALAYVLR